MKCRGESKALLHGRRGISAAYDKRVLAGFGAALLPEMAIRDELRRGELIALRVEGASTPKRTIHALWRAGGEPSATANALLRTLPRAS